MENGEKVRFYRPKGCVACNYTGFNGRVGIYEVLQISEGIEALIARNAPHVDIAGKAREEGMRTLKEDGFVKVKQGFTSLDEVLRVIM
jgi:type IV pilus assembly protein PilB